MDLALDVNGKEAKYTGDLALDSIEYYANEVKNMLYDKYNVVSEVIKTKKNNNVEYTSLLINEESKVRPTIHLDSFYNRDEDIEEVADVIKDLLDKEKDNTYMTDMEALVDSFLDYNSVKDKIYPYVVNAKLNEKDGCVKATFGDLSVIFKIRVSCDENNNFGTARIQEEMLEKWGIDLPTLIDDAYNNLRKDNIIITSIGNVLKNMFSQQLPPEIDQAMQEELENSNVFHVVTNQLNVGGAIYLTSPFYLNYICDNLRIKSMYIIPSSTEEILVLPASGRDKESEENMLDMVKEINANEVADNIYLADNIYFFDQKDSSYLTRIDNDEKIIFFSDVE